MLTFFPHLFATCHSGWWFRGSTHLQMWGHSWIIQKTLKESWPLHWMGATRLESHSKQPALAKGVPIARSLTPKSKSRECNKNWLVGRLRFWPMHDSYFLIKEQWISNSPLIPQYRLTARIDDQLQSFNMWHVAYYKQDMHQWLHLNVQSIHYEQSLTLNTVALIFLFKEKIFTTLTYNAYSDCQIILQHSFWKMENSLFTPYLNKLFRLWSNAYTAWTIWWGIWEWQWLCTTNSSYEVCAHLFSFPHWGLLPTGWLQGSLTHHLSLHAQMTQGWHALLWRGPPVPNVWWDTLTHTRSRLQWWWVSPNSGPGWSSMVWAACARQLGISVYPWNMQTSNPTPATQSIGDANNPT